MDQYVVVCLGGLTERADSQPTFSCMAYGPFEQEEAERVSGDIKHLHGGAVLVRPLTDWYDTIRRISAD